MLKTRYAQLGGLTLVVAAVGAVALSAHASTRAAAAERFHAEKYFAGGPSESCDGDSCGIGLAGSLRVAVPAGQPRRVVITVSASCRTAGQGVFTTSVSAKSQGHKVTVRPAERRLAPTTIATPVTQTVLAVDVPAGAVLEISPSVRIEARNGNRQAIVCRKTVVTVSG